MSFSGPALDKSSVVANNGGVYDSANNKKERVGRIVRLQADKREDVKTVYAGEIAAAVGLKDTLTSDSLCSEDAPIILERIVIPEPVISMRIEPKTKQDQEKMGVALGRLSAEDPTFRVTSDTETGETIIWGMGELHLRQQRQRPFKHRLGNRRNHRRGRFNYYRSRDRRWRQASGLRPRAAAASAALPCLHSATQAPPNPVRGPQRARTSFHARVPDCFGQRCWRWHAP